MTLPFFDNGTAVSRLLTPEEAAKLLGISEDTLRDIRKSGEIAYVNIGRGKKRETPRYELVDLLAWLEQRKIRACPFSSGKTPPTGRTPTTFSTAVADFQAALEKRRAGKRSR